MKDGTQNGLVIHTRMKLDTKESWLGDVMTDGNSAGFRESENEFCYYFFCCHAREDGC